MNFRRLALSLILASMLTSCLKTRDVEPPDVGSSDWISPSNYSILLENLRTAVGQKNVQNYLRCFRQEGLIYTPSTPVYTGNEILWENWSWQDENNWFNNVIQDLGITTGNQIVFNEVDLQSFSGDSLRYIGDYDMVMNHRDTSLTVRFKGQLEFLMKVNDFNEWEITSWIDYETSPDSSISRLKLNYVQ